MIAALAIVTHPAVMLPVSLIAIAFALPFDRHRRRLLLCWLVAVVVAVPATVLTLASPVVDETSRSTQVYSLVTTVLVRVLVLALPVLLDVLAARWADVAWLPASLAGLAVAVPAVLWLPFQLDVGWSGVDADAAAARAGDVPAGRTPSSRAGSTACCRVPTRSTSCTRSSATAPSSTASSSPRACGATGSPATRSTPGSSPSAASRPWS